MAPIVLRVEAPGYALSRLALVNERRRSGAVLVKRMASSDRKRSRSERGVGCPAACRHG